MSASAAEPHPGHEAGDDRPVSRRRKVVSLAVAGVLLASLAVAVALLAGSEGDGAGERLVAEGVIVDADADSVYLRLERPIDGRTELELAILPQDRQGKLELDHLLEHAQGGGPVRIHYERAGGVDYAREAYDLPGLR